MRANWGGHGFLAEQAAEEGCDQGQPRSIGPDLCDGLAELLSFPLQVYCETLQSSLWEKPYQHFSFKRPQLSLKLNILKNL